MLVNKRFFIGMVTLAIGLFFALPVTATEGGDTGHRLVSLLDYIAADYPEAVENGQVVNEFEFDEQLSMVADARDLLDDSATEQVRSGLTQLEESIRAKAAPQTVADNARAARGAVVAAYKVEMAPDTAPDLERGEELYKSNCVSCHALDGAAGTEAAKALNPAPTDFTDTEKRANLSPFRVFNTVTFGVEGTSMAAFPALSEQERWDLGFYVLSLAHANSDVAKPSKLPTLALLASTNDADLAASGASQAEIAWLRSEGATKIRRRSGIDVAIEHTARAERAWNAGDSDLARQELLTAYLDGFERAEARLSGVDHELVEQVEGSFINLRAAIRDGDRSRAEKLFVSVNGSLAKAADLLASDRDSLSGGLAAFLIVLREGVEIILLLALLLGLLDRFELKHAKRYVHAGWVGASVAGVITWFVAEHLIVISGASREVIEGVVGVLAAVVLFSVSYWFLSDLHGNKWAQMLKAKITDTAESGRLGTIAVLSFLAVYRELFEVILYFQALYLDSDAGAAPLAAGVGLAGALLGVFGYMVLRAGRRLPLKPFFAISGGALYLLSIIFIGKGLHSLIEGGVIPAINVVPLEVPVLGVYPHLVGLIAQGILVLLAVVWAAANFKSGSEPEAE